MAERRGPHVFTIPVNRAFADALAAGLIAQHGGDPMTLARGLILLPSNRAKLAVRDAFVRGSGAGLLLPRLVAIGDPEIDEAIGAALDPADETPVPPAVSPLERRMMLARLVAARDTAEAVRLAGDLGRTLDQLLVEGVAPRRLDALDLAPDLTEHWQRALADFRVVLDRWPGELDRIGKVDLAERRTRLLARLAERWRTQPPFGFVCAAGISTAAPAVAEVLATVSRLPNGSVVLPGLDRAMPDDEWRALGPHEPDPVTGPRPSIETHPQFQLKLLLDRMNVARGEVDDWPATAGPTSPPPRAVAVANAFAPARFTGKWTDLKDADRRLDDVRFAEFATPAEEAQAIAIALREALEEPGRTGALVTPDRGLARRVAAHLARWEIAVDDSAGRPLSATPPGTLLAALAEAAVQDFAPVPLLALLKHPLVQAGDTRPAWLEATRLLDRALRGPRPAPGLDGITDHLAGGLERERPVRRAADPAWAAMRPLLTELAAVIAGGPQPPARLVAALRQAAEDLCGLQLWAGPAGRAAAELLAELEVTLPLGPALLDPDSLPALLTTLMDEVAVRPPQGGHPRLAIYGLIEARLQTADLMILGGLNEGVWPGGIAPDPWLAPRVRAQLGLPGVERRVGLAAHDFASALGAPEVLVTRARRDAGGPALASRFWLRLQAMAGDRIGHADDIAGWGRLLDDPGAHAPATRPEPVPAAELRPKAISVTEVDRLKADPYAFYARRILKLMSLDPIDADPSAAWRGTAVHDVLQRWHEAGGEDPARLRTLAEDMLADARTHPLVRALWSPRLIEAIDWVAAELARNRAAGRRVAAVEQSGSATIAGIALTGRFDRVDRLADGALAIVDYKTGKAPALKAVAAGFSLQLGLLGLIAERGGFGDLGDRAGAFEYWSLAKHGDAFGKVTSPTEGRDAMSVEDFLAHAHDHFAAAADDWLHGDRAFTAKLVPEYAPYAEYDQLMRRDEWYGRE